MYSVCESCCWILYHDSPEKCLQGLLSNSEQSQGSRSHSKRIYSCRDERLRTRVTASHDKVAGDAGGRDAQHPPWQLTDPADVNRAIKGYNILLGMRQWWDSCCWLLKQAGHKWRDRTLWDWNLTDAGLTDCWCAAVAPAGDLLTPMMGG